MKRLSLQGKGNNALTFWNDILNYHVYISRSPQFCRSHGDEKSKDRFLGTTVVGWFCKSRHNNQSGEHACVPLLGFIDVTQLKGRNLYSLHCEHAELAILSSPLFSEFTRFFCS